MKPKSFLCTAALVLGAAPLLAQATLMEITVTGTVYDSYDQTGNVFGQGSGDDTVNGQTAVLKFTYDTANAPGDYYGGAYPYYAVYYNNTDWIESSATVGGSPVPDLVVNGNNSDYSYVLQRDYLPNYGSYDGIGAYDNYNDYNDGYDGNGNYFQRYGYSYNSFYFEDYVDDFLNSVDLNQTLSLVADGNNDYGYGEIYRYRYSYECLDAGCSNVNYDYQYGYAEFNINTITMSPRNAAIPEPGSLALLGLGLSGLAFVRRRKAIAR